MHWYEKLNQYFPIEEMKSREHHFYGESYQPTEEVLTFNNKEAEAKNILKEIE